MPPPLPTAHSAVRPTLSLARTASSSYPPHLPLAPATREVRARPLRALPARCPPARQSCSALLHLPVPPKSSQAPALGAHPCGAQRFSLSGSRSPSSSMAFGPKFLIPFTPAVLVQPWSHGGGTPRSVHGRSLRRWCSTTSAASPLVSFRCECPHPCGQQQ